MLELIALAGFATWTLVALLFSVGIYRWSRILIGRVEIAKWKADDFSVGGDFYYRAMRAHANCVENLSVFASLVLVGVFSGIDSDWFGVLAMIVFGARVIHTLIHLSFTQSNRVVSFRFTFYLVQVLAMLGMAALLLGRLL